MTSDVAAPVDPLWQLAGACAADRRADRLDLIVGVYRDDTGTSPVFAAVAEAERRLAQGRRTKEYVGPTGDEEFNRAVTALVLGGPELTARAAAIQSVAGTGALRLLAELLARTGPGRTVHLGTPSYVNHRSILDRAGLRVQEFPMRRPDGALDAGAALTAVERAAPGDVLLLQGCCHNPTGSSMPLRAWEELATAMVGRGVVPFVDHAYFGLGDGLEADFAGMRRMLEIVPAGVVAVSASKAWGLYSERTGCALVVSDDPGQRAVALAVMELTARASYSQPPAHGAHVVREVLGDPVLSGLWREELERNRRRLTTLRTDLVQALSARNSGLDPEALSSQRGMFLGLPLDAGQMTRLREEFAVYGLPSGRINLAGVPVAGIDRLAHAIVTVAARR